MKKRENIFTAFFILTSMLLVVTLLVFGMNLTRKSDTTVYNTRSLVGAFAAENGKETMRMYQVNEEYAFFVNGTYVALQKFEKTDYPLAFACGAYQGAAGTLLYAPKISGSYAYQQTTQGAWNILSLATGTLTEVTNITNFTEASLDPAQQPVTPEWITSQNYKELPYQKESCVSITLAEIILIIVSLGGIGATALFTKK